MPKNQDIRWKQRLQNFHKAFTQLESASKVENPDALQKQGVIQCFEYTFELAWKTLQDYLSDEKGYGDIRGPRPVLEQAFQDGIIQDGVLWLDMLKSRNLTTHLYDEAQMQAIYEKVVRDYFPHFLNLKQYFEKHAS